MNKLSKDSNYLSIRLYQEMSQEDIEFWFDFKQKKFLHNIDTFYYSVKLINDCTSRTEDKAVINFRKCFDKIYKRMSSSFQNQEVIQIAGENYNVLNVTFARFYNICIECPEYFHIFIAPTVPASGNAGTDSVTCEIVVQIRSYMLWMYGVHEAFERSYEIVKQLCNQYRLDIDFVQENRIDFCWHNNYFLRPESFFTIENIYKRRVDRYKDALFHTAKVGSEDYEVDYVAMGRRSGKVFVRIYNKTKEVVQQGYKPFFFKIWLFHGLINRYDFDLYERCFIKGSWKYLTIARLNFYLEHGVNQNDKNECKRLINQYEESGKVTDAMISLADRLTPIPNKVVNVEFQTMRKSTKSYELLPLRDNSLKEKCKRIYDFLDNRKLIIDYLTHDTFRLVKLTGDSNKSRRDYCAFWEGLRRCRIIDITKVPDFLELVRDTHRNLSKEQMKHRMINAAVTYGIYERGINDDNPMKDILQGLLVVNDNDINEAFSYKLRKNKQLNSRELPGRDSVNDLSQYVLVNRQTGLVYDDDNTYELISQSPGQNQEDVI